MSVAEKARRFFFRQKYRIDQSLSLLILVNFALLVLTASDKLKSFFGVESTTDMTILFVVFVFAGIWCMGYILEKKVKYQHGVEKASYEHSYLWTKLDGHLEDLKKEIREVRENVEYNKTKTQLESKNVTKKRGNGDRQ